ncbi:MAG: cyclic nucleotide-binding domain-containing protein, partial [Pseudomonadota bacterium]
ADRQHGPPLVGWAILHNTPRTAEVRASGYCHLLVLYARDVRRLLRQHPDIKAEIERVAETRMADPKDTSKIAAE